MNTADDRQGLQRQPDAGHGNSIWGDVGYLEKNYEPKEPVVKRLDHSNIILQGAIIGENGSNAATNRNSPIFLIKCSTEGENFEPRLGGQTISWSKFAVYAGLDLSDAKAAARKWFNIMHTLQISAHSQDDRFTWITPRALTWVFVHHVAAWPRAEAASNELGRVGGPPRTPLEDAASRQTGWRRYHRLKASFPDGHTKRSPGGLCITPETAAMAVQILRTKRTADIATHFTGNRIDYWIVYFSDAMMDVRTEKNELVVNWTTRIEPFDTIYDRFIHAFRNGIPAGFIRRTGNVVLRDLLNATPITSISPLCTFNLAQMRPRTESLNWHDFLLEGCEVGRLVNVPSIPVFEPNWQALVQQVVGAALAQNLIAPQTAFTYAFPEHIEQLGASVARWHRIMELLRVNYKYNNSVAIMVMNQIADLINDADPTMDNADIIATVGHMMDRFEAMIPNLEPSAIRIDSQQPRQPR